LRFAAPLQLLATTPPNSAFLQPCPVGLLANRICIAPSNNHLGWDNVLLEHRLARAAGLAWYKKSNHFSWGAVKENTKPSAFRGIGFPHHVVPVEEKLATPRSVGRARLAPLITKSINRGCLEAGDLRLRGVFYGACLYHIDLTKFYATKRLLIP
jgi:hypothetical protein